MKRLVLVALILLSGTAHGAVKKPVPLAEMFGNRLEQTDELTALKMLPSLHEVRRSWVASYEDWKDRQQAPETLDTAESLDTASWGTQIGPFAIPTYIVMCESGGNYDAENAVSTASGAYQIIDGSWAGYGGYSHASDAPPAVQDAKAALMWANGAGASHWAACL